MNRNDFTICIGSSFSWKKLSGVTNAVITYAAVNSQYIGTTRMIRASQNGPGPRFCPCVVVHMMKPEIMKNRSTPTVPKCAV